MKYPSLIKMILLCFALALASCTYTTKLGDKLLPDSEYNTLVVKADAAMQDGEWIKAADFYEKAGLLKPENWDLKLKEATAYQKAGKLAQAFNRLIKSSLLQKLARVTLRTQSFNQPKKVRLN
jgi:Flp pilus assembly protein TadD